MTIYNNYKKIFKTNPKIAVLGLNPHNAELRKNSEEREIILPAISFLKKNKIDVEGPLVADTIFIKIDQKIDLTERKIVSTYIEYISNLNFFV